MTRMMIELPDQAFSKLQDLASRERRPVKRQAAYIIELAVADVLPIRGYEAPRKELDGCACNQSPPCA
jgi:predicted transcriptional regulator